MLSNLILLCILLSPGVFGSEAKYQTEFVSAFFWNNHGIDIRSSSKSSFLAVLSSTQLRNLGTESYQNQKSAQAYDHFQTASPNSRSLSQLEDETETACNLSESDIGQMLDDTRRVWLVNDTALTEYDLQDIIDCTLEGDIVLFQVEASVQPSRRVVISKNLTLSGLTDDLNLNRGVFPSSDTKTRIRCPDDGIGVFFVKSSEALFANFIIEDCDFSDVRIDAGVVDVSDCDADSGRGIIRYHHITFRHNQLITAPGINTASGSCSSVEMVDVAYEDNMCSGVCGVVLSTIENVLRNIRISNNTYIHGSTESSAFILSPPNSTTVVEGMVASGNECAAIQVVEGKLDIRNSTFRGNKITTGSSTGIGIDLHKSNASLTNCQFEDNQGGADVSVLTLISCLSVEVNGCTFTRNANSHKGGGILSIRTSALSIKKSNFSNNSGSKGGAIYLNATDADIFSSHFEGNTAVDNGGALYAETNSRGILKSCSALNNSASMSGGFIYCEETDVYINDCQVEKNRARDGGGIFLSSGTAQLSNSTRVVDCLTEDRGGALFAEESEIEVNDTILEENSAKSGGCVYISHSNAEARNLTFVGCRSSENGGGLHSSLKSSLLCNRCNFENNSALGEGGAAFIDSRASEGNLHQFDRGNISFNSAVFGGGLRLVSDRTPNNCMETDISCVELILYRVLLVQNKATVGGAILVKDLNRLRYSCPSVHENGSEKSSQLKILRSLEGVCKEWEGNSANSYGHDVATFVRDVKKFLRREDERKPFLVADSVYNISNHRSGSPLPDISLEAIDQLGQSSAIRQGNRTLKAKMSSPDELFSGFSEVQFSDGFSNISSITPFREAGLYRVIISFNDEDVPPFTMLIEIRSCRLGEFSAVGGKVCQPCNQDTYNFFPLQPDRGCSPCPPNGNCRSHVIAPNQGHWHRTPCSTDVQECLVEDFCSDNGREKRMNDLVAEVDNCEFSEEFIRKYSDFQCKEGHRGPLCGSCKESFGKSTGLECERCPGRFSSYFLVVVLFLIMLVLSSFTIRSTLPSWSERTAVPENDDGVPLQEHMIERRTPERQEESEINAEVELGQEPANRSSKHRTDSSEMLRMRTVEIFKITINYLQAMAIALGLKVKWNKSLVEAFSVAELMAGISTATMTKSVDCLIPGDTAVLRSAARTVVTLLVPVLMILSWIVFWTIKSFIQKKSLGYWTKRVLLSTNAVSYIAYIAITKTAVSVLYCIDIYDSLDLEDPDKTRKYWAVDTEIICYEGAHSMLVGFFAGPLILFFSIGFPVTVTVVLIAARSSKRIRNAWLYESAGFLYRAYSPDFIFWESVILARKALMTVIVVFAYPLGGNLQGVFCMCILGLALYFQVICRPFRKEFANLNQLEDLSLLISSLTFASGLFLNDNHTSELASIVLTILLFFSNITLFGFFIFSFYRSGTHYLRTVLRDEGVSIDPYGSPFKVIKDYVALRRGRFVRRMKRSKDRSDSV